jgi:cysteine desulfurase
MRVGNTIYLDHQATTPADRRVVEAMLPYFERQFGNPHSADHALGWNAAKAVNEASEKIAAMIGADGNEVIFTSGATEANNLALLGLTQGGSPATRHRILMSSIEHKSVLAPGRILSDRLGYTVELIPVLQDGALDMAALASLLDDNVLLVSVMLVNSEIGTIQHLSEISELASACGAVFHSDCAQAPGAVDISELASLVDLASFSGHKIYGPKGIGALYVRSNLQSSLKALLHGGGQQGGLRAGTVPVPLCVGMGVASELVSQPLLRDELRRKRNRLVEALKGLPWSTALNGPDLDHRHPGNANIRFEGFVAADVLAALQPKLAASTGSACTSGTPEPSHVLRAIGLSAPEAESSIRFSIGRHTTNQEIDEAVGLIKNVLVQLVESGAAEPV